MESEEFRSFLKSEGVKPCFEIPRDIHRGGVQLQLNRLRTRYELGSFACVVVYDGLQLAQALSAIKSTVGDMFACVDFSYAQTIGKKRVQPASADPTSDLLSHLFEAEESSDPTSGLLSHLFEAEETDFDEPTLILYHSFNAITDAVVRLSKGERLAPSEYGSRQILNLIEYIDGIGREWSDKLKSQKSKSPRLPKISGENPIIRCAAVLSIDEQVANDWYTYHWTNNTRSDTGLSVPVDYIF